MSYILEALRKSEQERNPEKVPDLTTHHQQVLHDPRPQYTYWIIAVLFLIIIAMMLYYFFTKAPAEAKRVQTSAPVTNLENEAKPATETNDTDSKIEKATTFSGKITEKVVETQPPPIKKNTVEKVPTGMFKPPATKPAISELDRAALPDIAELNYEFQQQIPDMEFSTHIYVSDGGSFVIINGKSLSEGMPISRGLIIQQIISDGIVLEFRGRRFFLASMTNWQQN